MIQITSLSGLPRLRLFRALTATIGVFASAWLYAQGPQLELPRAQLQAGLYRIDAQVASTPQQREVGLMFRRDMPEHEGMLFVFEKSDAYCFWMKNTLLPLSAAFIDDQGRVVNVVEMQAQTTTPHCAKAPVRYVLEMNQGWFSKRHIGEGFSIKGYAWSGAKRQH